VHNGTAGRCPRPPSSLVNTRLRLSNALSKGLLPSAPALISRITVE
jgi:hypothetical protein